MLNYQAEEPISLSVEEYVYLTDTLEPLTRRELQDGAAARFVVRSRQETLQNLVRCVLNRELTDEERTVAKLLFLDTQSVSEAARRLGVSRKRIYTLSGKAEQKLNMYLKYPFLMDFSLLAPARPFAETLKQYGGMQ